MKELKKMRKKKNREKNEFLPLAKAWYRRRWRNRSSVAGTFGAWTRRQSPEPTRRRMLHLLVHRRVHLQVIGAREVSGHHSGGVHGGAVAQQRHRHDEDHQNHTQFPEIHIGGPKPVFRGRIWNEGKVFDDLEFVGE